MSRPPACPCRTLLLTSSQVSSSRLRPTSSGSQSAALCSQARARSGARGPPAMLSRSAGLDPATGSGCKRGASRVVVGMGGSRPGVGAWVGSSGPASAGTSAENKTFLPAWTDDRCHALTSSACRNHPGPPFRMRERGDYRSMNSMNVTFLTREDEGFDAARQAWNLAVDQRPAAVAYANDAGEVAGAVRLAAQRGLRVAVQGTGHSAAPLGDLEGTLLLKTMRMTGLEVDPAARRARAEAGGLWRDVGVVGYLLGGGLGWLGRRHGLACNRVVSAEVVTADGELRRVGPDEEPELFWALRGGGGSFGAVTAIEFERLPRVVTGRAARDHDVTTLPASAAVPGRAGAPARPARDRVRRRLPRIRSGRRRGRSAPAGRGRPARHGHVGDHPGAGPGAPARRPGAARAGDGRRLPGA